MGKVFVGHDWAEIHHDIYIEDDTGARLARTRVPDGIEGIGRVHELLADTGVEPADVVVATETDRGLFVGALVAAGYDVVAVNPFSAARYRERHSTSGAKSDPGDAYVLAEIARLDRHNHRPIAGDTDLAEAVKVLARAHQAMIWTRQRQTNQLRSTLREFYPAALNAFGSLHSADALAILAVAPTPAMGRAMSKSKIQAALRRGGDLLVHLVELAERHHHGPRSGTCVESTDDVVVFADDHRIVAQARDGAEAGLLAAEVVTDQVGGDAEDPPALGPLGGVEPVLVTPGLGEGLRGEVLRV